MGKARDLARLSPNTSGQLPDSNILSVAANKLSGVLPDANAPSGSVIQVVQTVKTDTFSSSSNSFVDITGLSVSITPTSASNRILVLFHLVRGSDSATLTTFRLVRDSAPVGNGTPTGNRAGAITTTYSGVSDADATQIPGTGMFLDSPNTTSTVTYKIQVLQQPNSTAWIGRSGRDSNLAEFGRSSSSITVMEISA